MNKIHGLAEINMLNDNEALIRYDGSCTYVRHYEGDGFRFHDNPFLSGWYDEFKDCKIAAIDYLFSKSDILTLLQKLICLIITDQPWIFNRSAGRLTIIVADSTVAVVDMSLKVIHATDDDIQCSMYGFIESVIPYKNL